MSKRKIIGGLLITGAIGTAAYLLYKRYAPQTSTAPVTPAGTSPTGVQQYLDKAGNLVDKAGTVLTQASNVAANLIPKGTYEGKLIRVNKGKVYLVRNGLKNYVPSLPKNIDIDPAQPWLGTRTLTWAEVIEVNTAIGSSIPDGLPLSGLGCPASLILS